MEVAASSNSSLIPSARDLLLVVPRLAQTAGWFALHVPEAMDNIAGKIWNGGSVIADATAQQTVNSTITNTSTAFAQSATEAGMVGLAGLEAAITQARNEGYWVDTMSSMFGAALQAIGRLKNVGGIFSYVTSRWALATFTVVSAIIWRVRCRFKLII